MFSFDVQVRKGVLEVLETNQDEMKQNNQESVPKYLVKVSTTSTVWRDILCKETSAVTANINGYLSCDPGIRQLGRFMEYFDFPSR